MRGQAREASAGTDYSIVSDTTMNMALEQFGYPSNAILSPANALILAKQIPGTKGIITSTLTRQEGGPYSMTSRLFGVQSDAGVVQSAQQQPGEKLDAFGARAAEAFEPAFDAFDDAKECEDLRATKPDEASEGGADLAQEPCPTRAWRTSAWPRSPSPRRSRGPRSWRT